MNNNFLEILRAILRHQHAQNQGHVINTDISGIERQSDLLGVLYTLKHNENTLPEMNNNFSEVLSQILGYHHAQNQG